VLDVDGDGSITASIDGVLWQRYLLGYRGNALTTGLTIPGPRNVPADVEPFLQGLRNVNLFAVAPAPPEGSATATQHGLALSRLATPGFSVSNLLNGVAKPAGAAAQTGAAVAGSVDQLCGTKFASP